MENQRAADEKTVEFFDSIANDYYDLYDETTPGGYAFVLRRQHILSVFDQPGGMVLDVGCGSGVMVESLTALNCDYWGVDPAEKMIEDGKKRFSSRPNVHLAVGSAEKLDFPDNHFDAVLCMGVLERVKDDRNALAEMVRVLKPGGTLLVTVPNKYSPYFLWRDYLFYPVVSLLRPIYFKLRGWERRPVIPGHRMYSAKAFGEMVSRLNCRVTEVMYMGFNLLLPPLDMMFPGTAVSVMRKGEALQHGKLRYLAGGLILKANKQ